MKWRHLNKPRPPSKGYKMSSLAVGAWHSWQQLCQIEEQVLWPGRQPNPSRRTSLRPTFSPSFSPAKFISKRKAASKWLLLFPALQNGKALQFYFIRTNKFKREEKYFSGLVLASGTLLGLLSVSQWGEKGSIHDHACDQGSHILSLFNSSPHHPYLSLSQGLLPIATKFLHV